MPSNGRLAGGGGHAGAGPLGACAPAAGFRPPPPSALGPPGAGSAAAMLLRGGPHLSPSRVALTLSRGILEGIPLLTRLCFPATLRVAFEDTKWPEGVHTTASRSPGGPWRCEPASCWTAAPASPLSPASAASRGSPTANCAAGPAPRGGPARRSLLDAGACDPLEAPPESPPPGVASPPPARPGPVGGRGAASTGWRR